MKHPRIHYLIILLLFAIIGALVLFNDIQAKSITHLDFAKLDAFLEEQVKTNHIPGLAIAVIQGDQIIFQKGYGEAAAGKPVTPQTQFYIGSVSKSLTALGVMTLVEQGKLDLDTPVQEYIPWFKVADAQASSQITVRHLLNHTSGLSEKGDPNASTYTSSLEEQARLLSHMQPGADPGKRYEYYNQNYRLLGYLIEKVSGQSYGDFMKAEVFTPLGMADTLTRPQDAHDLAQGYSRVFGFSVPRTQTYVPGSLPSGYLISTAEDMAKFLIAQLNNERADGRLLLQPSYLALMRTPPQGVESNYGMGWLVMENGNTLVHGGALEYFQAFIAIGLKERLGFVVLFNQNSLSNLFFENTSIRDGLVNFLNGKPAQPINYSWIGWLLITLAAADLLNHIRLYLMIPHWVGKCSKQPRLWLWIKIAAGMIIPLTVIFGLPLVVKILQGGSPSWEEPFKLAPDLTGWLLIGMTLNLVRSMIHAISLVRNNAPQSQ